MLWLIRRFLLVRWNDGFGSDLKYHFNTEKNNKLEMLVWTFTIVPIFSKEYAILFKAISISNPWNL